MVGAFIAVLIFRALWMFGIVAGTSYVVFGLGYSGWWWLLAVVLLSFVVGGEFEVKSRK